MTEYRVFYLQDSIFFSSVPKAVPLLWFFPDSARNRARIKSQSLFLGAMPSRNSSRSSTPHQDTLAAHPRQDGLQRSQGGGHTISYSHHLNLHRYPKDCPLLKPRWFYAVDTPKYKLLFPEQKRVEAKSSQPPKKFVPFSPKDSQSIETAFQRLVNSENTRDGAGSEESAKERSGPTKVPVNEDYLFDVNVEQRELSPAYWLGPVYEVRRGTWFYQEGSTLKPCDENLATQLEEGYLKVKPWQFQDSQLPKSRSLASSVSNPRKGPGVPGSILDPACVEAMNPSHDAERFGEEAPSAATNESHRHRLFGAYLSTTATYQDSSTALLTSNDFVSRMSSTVYQTLGGVAGTKVARGYSEPNQPKEMEAKSPESQLQSRIKSESPMSSTISGNGGQLRPEEPLTHESPLGPHLGDRRTRTLNTAEEKQRSMLERRMSSLISEPQTISELQDAVREQEEEEMVNSGEADGDERGREIDHLVLVTHGIGQRLGLRLESINFVHDVNVLRKTMKSVYAASPDLQALNSALPDAGKNCRVQVLPVCWRHLIDFPKKRPRQNRRELDLADADNLTADDAQYPALADITLEGVPTVRNLISDLAMDVLLYQSRYRSSIATVVQQECNRIFRLFKQRNPSFKGSVSLCGHSLGSAILFDILCDQPSTAIHSRRPGTSRKGKRSDTMIKEEESGSFLLDFKCQAYFCLGSPIALFQMLEGNTITGRSVVETSAAEFSVGLNRKHGSLVDPAVLKDHYTATFGTHTPHDIPAGISSPKCEQLYNIFHPSDPISYRLEPLISAAMTALKPQPLPSVKKNIWTASSQSLTNIGSRVGQSVGSLWTNFTSGVASSLLNRSLGLNADDSAIQIATAEAATDDKREGHNSRNQDTKYQEKHVQTLIDQDLETLYEGFRKSKRYPKNLPQSPRDALALLETEKRVKKLKMEEAKVRALNSNGRVDYCIQE